jgi:hypothetical protein
MDSAIVAAGIEWRKICEQGRIQSGAYVGARDAQRMNDLEERSFAAARALTDALVDKLAAASGPEQAGKIQSLRQSLTIESENAQIFGGSSGMIEVSMPNELWRSVSTSVDRLKDEVFTANREAILALQTAHAQERIDALKEFQQALRDNRLARAKLADSLKIAGRLETEVRAEDDARWREVAKFANDPDGMEAARQRAQDLSATQKMMAFWGGPQQSSPAWRRLLKAQITAFEAVEPRLPPELLTAARRYWLSGLLRREHVDLALPLAEGSWEADPQGFLHNVMRIARLDSATRERVRVIGNEWLDADAKIVLDAAKAVVRNGTAPSPTEARKELAKSMVARVAEVTKVPFTVGREAKFPDEARTDELSDIDAANYGEVLKPQPSSEATARAIARSQIRPWKYAPDMVEDLAELLHATADQRAVIDVAIADARDRWEAAVAPLVQKSLEPPYSPRSSYEQVVEWRAKLLESAKNAEAAFQAAYACDAKLFADLGAALAGSVDANTLAVAEASRRSGEGTLISSRTAGDAIVPNAIDIPRAALTAPLSPEGRKLALGALAPAAPRWSALGKERCAFIRQLWPMQCEGYQVAAQPDSSSEYEQRKQEFLAGLARINAAWTTAEREAIDGVAQVLSPQDAAIWRSETRRLRWPQCYYSVASIGKAARNALDRHSTDAALREALQAVVAHGEAEAVRSGDAGVALVEPWPAKLEPLGTRQFGGDDSTRVLRHLRAMDPARADLLAEQVRVLLGEDVPDLRRQANSSRRLAGPSTSATAAGPASP